MKNRSYKTWVLSACMIMGGYLSVFSQNSCITPELPFNKAMGISSRSMLAEEAYREYVGYKKGSRDDQLLQLPMVVHVVYPPGSSPAISVEQILAKLDAVNVALSGQAVCAGEPDGEDLRIALCPAIRKTDNTPSESVYYYEHTESQHNACVANEPLYQVVRDAGQVYPTDQYLNIYVVESICAPCMPTGCHVAGYASYAPSHGMLHDGIVLERWLLDGEDCTTTKVIMHELGHYLNLLHTFSPDCRNDDCLEDGDKVCDTPPMTSQNTYPSHPCLNGEAINTCTTDVNLSDPNNPFLTDQPDASDNYMSYVPPGCMMTFTPGQRIRARSAIESLRYSLLQSKGCLPPCDEPVVWQIEHPQNIYAGEPATWTNLTGGNTAFVWRVQGAEYTTLGDLEYTFDTSGIYEISVYTADLQVNCADTLTFEVEVKCSIPEMSFTISAEVVEPGEEIHLINTSPLAPGVTYSWIVEGDDFGMDDLLTLNLTNEGTYRVYLMGCNQYCCHRSASRMIRLGPCQEEQAGREWHFGIGVGLRFQENGSIEQVVSSILSAEASTMAYDENGGVLFYSNGARIWNRNHEIMSNGNGLLGGLSATQALTLRQPGSDDLWYLFHPDQIENVPVDDPNIKMYYSIIDMSLNGGLGEVVLKNELLFEYSTEKVTAIRHCNGIDWWVIMHELGSSNFRVYSLTDNGLNSNPMIQSIGSFIESAPYAAASYIRPNNEGTILSFIKGGTFGNTENSSLEFFRFDRESGILSDPLLIFDDRIGFYGAEFSPNSSKFYITDSYSSFLHQFEISEWDAVTILESEYVFESFSLSNAGALCLGPDSIIYIATGQFFLHAILEPDLQAPNNQVIEQYYDTGDKRVVLGLPNFPNDIYNTPKPDLKGPKEVCDTTAQAIYFVQSYCTPDDHDWSYRGGGSLSILSGDSVRIDFNKPGIDTLIVWKETACRVWSDTLLIQVAACRGCNIEYTLAESDTIVCLGQPAYLRLNTEADSVTMKLLPNGDPVQVSSGWIDLGTPMVTSCFELYMSLDYGCDTLITFCVHVNEPQTFEWLHQDTTVCYGEFAQINFNTSATLVELLDLEYRQVITNPGLPLSLGPFESDSCYLLRLRTPEMDCDTIIFFCVRLDNSIEFDWINADTIYCIEHDPILLFDTPADQVQIYDQSQNELTGVIQGNSITGLEDGCYELLMSEEGRCAHSVPFCLEGISAPELTWIDSIGRVCEGHQVEWTFSSNAAVIAQLSGSDTLHLLNNRLVFPELNADTCLQIYLRAAGCEQIISACINVDSEINQSTDTLRNCHGDTIWIDDEWLILQNDTSWTDIFTFDHQCDSFAHHHIILYPEIQPDIEVKAACYGMTDGRITIGIPGDPIDWQIIWEHTPEQTWTLIDLAPGEYYYTLIDENGCSKQFETVIESRTIDIQNIQIEGPVCSDDSNGFIQIHPHDNLTITLNEIVGTSGRIGDLPSGQYTVRIADVQGCILDTLIHIPAPHVFEISLPELIQIIEGNSARIDAEITITGAAYYTWVPPMWLSCSDCPQPVSTPQESIIYILTVEDERGCIKSDSVRIVVLPEFPVYIPSAFSPNSDGINDAFEVYSENESFELLLMEIYDRNGSKMYSCKGSSCKWTGTFKGQQVQPGPYIYLLEIQSPEGEIIKKSGEVIVMR